MTSSAPTFRSRLWRWTKRLARVTTAIVIAAISAATFGVPAASRTAWARERLETTLTRSLGTPVQVGAMQWSWKRGLLLQHVSTSENGRPTAFRIERIQLRPRLVKLLDGKLRLRAVVENPEFLLTDTGAALRVPKLPKKGIRIDQFDLVNATLAVRSGDETARVQNLTIRGDGRVEDRVLRLELSSLSGTCDGATFSGQGTLRVSGEGLSGRIGVNEAAAKESASLQKVLRALHMSPAKAPLLSEPF
jgi:hypothetical protein